MSDRGTWPLVDIIQYLVDAYNNSRHCSIGMSPPDLQKKDEKIFWVRLFGDGNTHLKPQILQKAIMRTSSQITNFDKGYMPNLTKEHFTVSKAAPP